MSAASCSEVEQAWLDAGRRGDAKTMQGLRKLHPKWLALDRVVAAESSPKNRDEGDEAPSFCDWEKFHLPTVGVSALHAAAWDGEYDVLEFLLKEGQQERLWSSSTRSWIAVRKTEERLHHTLRVVKLLLRHGAETEARDNEGKTALFLATNDELFEVAKLLLENGARLDAQDSIGRSPLHACLRTAVEQSVLVTNLLVSRGAPIDLPDKTGETPFTIVVRHGDITALQLLLNHHSLVATPARQDFSGAVLLQAAELGVVDVVRFLLDGKYTSVDIVNARGETALHLAIMKQRKELVEMMCKSKSAELLLAARTKGKGESVLHYAARYGSPSDVQSVLSLLGKGASSEVNVASAQGLTPLYLATTASTAGSPSERRAKVAQLEKLGASLFSSVALLFREVKNAAGVAASSPTAFSDFCVNWVACVQRPQINPKQAQQATTKQQAPIQHRVPLTPALSAFVCAGYASDSIPLLLSLPLKLKTAPRFLELLKTLAVDTKHALLQKLQVELQARWKIKSDDCSRSTASAPKAAAPVKAKK
ncbi:hypothetical protein PF010_g6690 [Phytophthora fragariae]|uniref:Uncharacterized protein n=1 Tax=Phytophthora fragariae TaxID=53985 RepID=A0A6G0LKN1_9STRA|nr:hypothetical protein PF010_g6690 [Phytophthora fragariae]